MTALQCSFKYVVFLNGIVTHYGKSVFGRGRTHCMIHVVENRFSRGIKMIVVTKRVPPPPPLTQELLYDIKLGIAVDQAIEDGSAQKLFSKYAR